MTWITGRGSAWLLALAASAETGPLLDRPDRVGCDEAGAVYCALPPGPAERLLEEKRGFGEECLSQGLPGFPADCGVPEVPPEPLPAPRAVDPSVSRR